MDRALLCSALPADSWIDLDWIDGWQRRMADGRCWLDPSPKALVVGFYVQIQVWVRGNYRHFIMSRE